MTGATERVASFISRTSLEAMPAEAVPKAKKAIADTFAAILSGVGSEVAEPLRRYLQAAGASGAVPILGTGTTSAPDTAALVNGTFGHALDFDDVLSMMPAHPSAVILAALIASLGTERVTGRALIEAYVIGIEVGGKIGLGMTVGHYHRGYHATGSLALFSALAALLKLHRVDVPLSGQAFGIAASMASGLRRNFGTMTKPLHTGIAARSALTAWRLATCGFTAAPDILEAKSGLYSTLGVSRLQCRPDSGAAGTSLRHHRPRPRAEEIPLLLRVAPCDGRTAYPARADALRRGLRRARHLPHAARRNAGSHLSAAEHRAGRQIQSRVSARGRRARRRLRARELQRRGGSPFRNQRSLLPGSMRTRTHRVAATIPSSTSAAPEAAAS